MVKLNKAPGSVALNEDQPPAAIIRLRGASAFALAALGAALGIALPETPNTYARAGATLVCWLAPGEWAIIGAAIGDVRHSVQSLGEECTYHVADMSGAWLRWRLTGDRAAELLNKGCSLDLDPVSSSEVACARTLLGQVSILLVRNVDGWDIFAERALSAHIRAWFKRAARGCCQLEELRAP
ncbi:MAG: hypothetical protein M0D54_01420 [Hyphomonadaceae bacterium JAD_PAG50586_4]|jgi:sarcosine oxidase subunit gamma|nr:MAG: hypothetical protein M0D54_01420 [Hyphomonadaceae bacterium JAD_PAG50586_4]